MPKKNLIEIHIIQYYTIIDQIYIIEQVFTPKTAEKRQQQWPFRTSAAAKPQRDEESLNIITINNIIRSD